MGYTAKLLLTTPSHMTRFTVFLLLLLMITGCDKQPPETDNTATVTPTSPTSYTPRPALAIYVGSEQCQGCHASQHQEWLLSDHHKAMMPMDDKNILGDFTAPPLKHHQQQTEFSHHDGHYQFSTDQKTIDQKTTTATTVNLAYTFGVFPLQQYLTELPDGHWQSLPFAWDSRTAQAGGQRWFHLYQDEKIIPGDVLHWRSPSHNANHMCIECHTTNFVKNYAPKNNSYQSSWQEIGVGCESCHGPGSNHLAWAQNKTQDAKKGWDIQLTSGSLALWQHQTDTTKAQRTQPGNSLQTDRCAQCHSRRSRISTNNYEALLLDAFLPSLLDETLYHADGQIQDEVYEYGSFMQSKMADKGVTCSNCHNPHTGKTKIEGNGLCLQCHNASYEKPEHTLHIPGASGSFCVDCHMPATTYMQVDARRDHSFRIPRPDLTTSIGTPNACNGCHTDKSAQWATEKLDNQFGPQWKKPHYGEVFAQARQSKPSSYNALVALIHDSQQTAIVRATALSLLGNFTTRPYHTVLADIAGDAEPLIRLGTLRATGTLSPDQLQTLLPVLQGLLHDEQRAIRIEAARLLAGNPVIQNNSDFIRARQEYIDSEMINADRAAALTNLAGLAIREQRLQDAETLLLNAIKLEPYYIPAAINLADLYRMTQRDPDGEKIMQAAMKIVPDNAELNMSYALMLVRKQQTGDALAYLSRAAASGDNPYFSYVYALALQQVGKLPDALKELDRAAAMPVYNRDVQIARIELARTAQRYDLAEKYLAEWRRIDPDDPAFQNRQ